MQYKNPIAAAEATGTASAPRPVSAAILRLSELRSSQNETHEVIAELAARLSDVMGPPLPQEGNAKSEPPSTSPLCDELDSRISSDTHARSRLREIIARLTV